MNSNEKQIYEQGFQEGRSFEREKIERDLYKISVCYFPDYHNVEMTIEEPFGEKVAFNFEIGRDVGEEIAEVIGPCVYHKAKLTHEQPNQTNEGE